MREGTLVRSKELVTLTSDCYETHTACFNVIEINFEREVDCKIEKENERERQIMIEGNGQRKTIIT